MSIFCDYCGKELPDGSVFCSQCGTKILHQSVRPTPEFQEDASEKRFDKAPYSASWTYKKAGRGILKIINTVTVSLSENMLTVYERWHSTLSERDAAQHTRELPRGEICRAEVRKRRLSPLYLLLLIVCTAAVFFIAGEVGANGPISAAVALAFAAVLALFYRFDLCHPELQLHLTSGKKVRLPAANVKDLAPVHTEIVKWAGLKSDADVIREKPKSRKKRVLIAVGIVAGAAAVIIGGVSCFEQFYLLRKLPETVLTSEAAVDLVREQMKTDFNLDSLDTDIRIEGGRLADTPSFPQKEGKLYTFFSVDAIYDVVVTNANGENVSGTITADMGVMTALFAQEPADVTVNQLEYSDGLITALKETLQEQPELGADRPAGETPIFSDTNSEVTSTPDPISEPTPEIPEWLDSSGTLFNIDFMSYFNDAGYSIIEGEYFNTNGHLNCTLDEIMYTVFATREEIQPAFNPNYLYVRFYPFYENDPFGHNAFCVEVEVETVDRDIIILQFLLYTIYDDVTKELTLANDDPRCNELYTAQIKESAYLVYRMGDIMSITKYPSYKDIGGLESEVATGMYRYDFSDMSVTVLDPANTPEHDFGFFDPDYLNPDSYITSEPYEDEPEPADSNSTDTSYPDQSFYNLESLGAEIDGYTFKLGGQTGLYMLGYWTAERSVDFGTGHVQMRSDDGITWKCVTSGPMYNSYWSLTSAGWTSLY